MEAKQMRNYYLHKGVVSGRLAVALLWINGAWPYQANTTVRVVTGEMEGFRNILIESDGGAIELVAVEHGCADLVSTEGMYVIYQDPETGRSHETKLPVRLA